jgi:hypothetical protein
MTLGIYFSIGYCQPFAKMATERVDGFESVEIVTADGEVVGVRLDDPREVVRLDELITTLNLDPEKMWSRLRADDDVLNARRQATWGGGGA